MRSRRRIQVFFVVFAIVFSAAFTTIASFNQQLVVSKVRVEGAKIISQEALDAAFAHFLGRNIVSVSQESLQNALAAFPAVQFFAWRLDPAGALSIQITERQPVAYLVQNLRFLYVDASGVVLKEQNFPPLEKLVFVDVPHVDSEAFRAVIHSLAFFPKEVGTIVSARARDSTHVEFTFRKERSLFRVVWGSQQESQEKARVLRALVIATSASKQVYDVSTPRSPTTRP